MEEAEEEQEKVKQPVNIIFHDDFVSDLEKFTMVLKFIISCSLSMILMFVRRLKKRLTAR